MVQPFFNVVLIQATLYIVPKCNYKTRLKKRCFRCFKKFSTLYCFKGYYLHVWPKTDHYTKIIFFLIERAEFHADKKIVENSKTIQQTNFSALILQCSRVFNLKIWNQHKILSFLHQYWISTYLGMFAILPKSLVQSCGTKVIDEYETVEVKIPLLSILYT